MSITYQSILDHDVVGTSEEDHAVDAQAIARAHRLRHDKPVEAVRFIASGTIEQENNETAYEKRQKSARK